MYLVCKLWYKIFIIKNIKVSWWPFFWGGGASTQKLISTPPPLPEKKLSHFNVLMFTANPTPKLPKVLSKPLETAGNPEYNGVSLGAMCSIESLRGKSKLALHQLVLPLLYHPSRYAGTPSVTLSQHSNNSVLAGIQSRDQIPWYGSDSGTKINTLSQSSRFCFKSLPEKKQYYIVSCEVRYTPVKNLLNDGIYTHLLIGLRY